MDTNRSVRWVSGQHTAGLAAREVFTIDGVEYVRTPNRQLAAITITEWKRAGLPPLFLKPRRKAVAA